MESDEPKSRDASMADLGAEFGVSSIEAWPDMDKLGLGDEHQVQAAFDHADVTSAGMSLISFRR